MAAAPEPSSVLLRRLVAMLGGAPRPCPLRERGCEASVYLIEARIRGTVQTTVREETGWLHRCVGPPLALEGPELEAWAARTIATFLELIGGRSVCHDCRREVFWIRSSITRKNVPFGRDGMIHFATCSARRRRGD